MPDNNILNTISQMIQRHEIGLAIEGLENHLYTSATPQPRILERLSDIKADYQRLVDYWQQGYEDPQRQSLFDQLCRRLFELTADVATRQRTTAATLLSSLHTQTRKNRNDWSVGALKHDLEAFVSDVAMLDLVPPQAKAERQSQLFRQHQQLGADLFGYILTSRSWSNGVEQSFEEMLLSPTVDTIDQQLIVSAVTLAAMNIFDFNKFRLLARTYQQATDEAVRQRALVGWVLTLDADMANVYPELRQQVTELTADEQTCEELAELQMQLLYCLSAEDDHKTIQREIMPDLLKNNNFRVTRHGIEEVEDDPMEDILHPDAAEQRMEKMEESMRRMIDMQKAGSDIYFGGFSQMKRFPFFSSISNWFVPFYSQHPDISSTWDNSRGRRFLHQLMRLNPFCNSDKYSFVLAFNQIASRLPENLMNMLEQGEATLDGSELGLVEEDSPAIVRRAYLQDLFRFFRVYPQRSVFRNPFDGHYLFCEQHLFRGTALESRFPGIAAFMAKRKRYDEAARVLNNATSLQSFQYYMVRASVSMHTKSDQESGAPMTSALYAEALRLKPDNEQALKGYARALFSEHDYDASLVAYEKLLEVQPDNRSYLLNKAVCMVNLARYAEAQKLLYQLNFEYPDDQTVERVLAWTLVGDGKQQQAERIYKRLLESGTPQPDDLLNYGYCLWLSRRVAEAIGYFRQYAAAAPEGFNPADEFGLHEAQLLARHGISPVEVQLMADQLR